jgi:hypothetical protein
MSASTALSYWSGLAFVAPELPWPTLVGTVLIVHICDAIMCRLFAHNNGRPKTLWTVLGFVGGLWAVAALLLLPGRAVAPAEEP